MKTIINWANVHLIHQSGEGKVAVWFSNDDAATHYEISELTVIGDGSLGVQAWLNEIANKENSDDSN